MSGDVPTRTGSATAVVFARMTSSRLPGKVLADIGGTPLLALLVERLVHCAAVSDVVVATSTTAADDPVAAAAHGLGVACHRGPLDDVAARAVAAAALVGADRFFRANGDSPFLPVELYAGAIEQFDATDADVVSNVSPRRFPPGASVELVRTATLERALADMTAEEAEHVTLHLYRHADQYRIVPLDVEPPEDRSESARLVVDTAEDLERARSMAGLAAGPLEGLSLAELLALHDAAGIPA